MRLVGIAAFDLTDRREPQLELFGAEEREKDTRLDEALDAVRGKFGLSSLRRARHLKR